MCTALLLFISDKDPQTHYIELKSVDIIENKLFQIASSRLEFQKCFRISRDVRAVLDPHHRRRRGLSGLSIRRPFHPRPEPTVKRQAVGNSSSFPLC